MTFVAGSKKNSNINRNFSLAKPNSHLRLRCGPNDTEQVVIIVEQFPLHKECRYRNSLRLTPLPLLKEKSLIMLNSII